ncbi:B9 protein, putative, partial [Ixodes scapularis]
VAQLYLEVISQDFWSRFHVEGYAYCDVSNNPGRTSMSLKTWRPVSTRLDSRMRRFFTGGDPQLRDLSNTAVPADAAPAPRTAPVKILLFGGIGKIVHAPNEA